MYQRELTDREALAARRIITDPVRFCGHFFASELWKAQRWIMARVAEPHSRTSVKACNASGKTFVAALAVLWFVTRYRPAIAITTAPTWTQVERLLWKEIHKAIGRGSIPYQDYLNNVELNLAPDNYAIGISTNEAERFQGFHEKRALIIFDEGPGVKPPIWEGAEGIRAGGDVRILALGNPVIASGPFYETHTSQRDTWNTLTIGAFDTPNFSTLLGNRNPAAMKDEQLVAMLERLSEDELHDNVMPDLTTRHWVWEKWLEWGQHGHPLWDARVMGRFPRQSTDALIALAWAEEAANRDTRFQKRGDVSIGIDVAGPGEAETALYVVEGANIIELHSWADPDPRGKVIAVLNTWKKRNPHVKCDSAGLGHYFVEHIRDMGFSVTGINVGTATSDPERFTNLKGELYSALRERFSDGMVNGLVDTDTVSQLTAIKYKLDSRGRFVVESKDEMAKRGTKSPDRAEALMLAFAAKGDGGSDFAFV